MSLGFTRAGFRAVGSVERDQRAAETYARNFHDNRRTVGCEIQDLEPARYLAGLGIAGGVDVLVGGPPCQAYARVGRAKLRAVRNHPLAFRLDPRGALFQYFLDWVSELRPLAVVIENVPDMLNYGGTNLAHTVCSELAARGYTSRYGLLNSVHYGVPQSRERLFIVAVSRFTGMVPVLPEPTHAFALPSGYQIVRRAAEKHAVDDPYRLPPSHGGGHLPAVTAWEALADLPATMGPHSRREQKEMAAWTGPYREDMPPSAYAMAMRNWVGYASEGRVRDHVTRVLLRDYETFARMPLGAEYPAAVQVAEEIFEEHVRTGRAGPGDRNRYVPPYDPRKFPNKWWKLDPGRPSRTLTAHMGKDTYSHIHYDAAQARTITVREAARLQSFPDGFRFSGAMNDAFRQIGNAVPPLLAYAVARQLLRQLQGEDVAALAEGLAR